MSKRFRLNKHDFVMWSKYILVTLSIWYAQNQLGIQEWILNNIHLDAQTYALGISFLAILVKKFIQDNKN